MKSAIAIQDDLGKPDVPAKELKEFLKLQWPMQGGGVREKKSKATTAGNKIMKFNLAVFVVSLVSVIPAMGTTIDQWTFESTTPTTAGSISPETGSGTGTAVHVSSSTAYSSLDGDGSANSWSANHWAVGDYWQFSVSTLGFQDIVLSWDQTGSSTGPGVFGLFWSVTGLAGSFTQIGIDYNVPEPTTTWDFYSKSLSSILALNNTSTVYFRLIDESSEDAAGTGTVGTTGTDRIDNFTVSGGQIPASVPDSPPGFAGLCCILGLLAVSRRIGNASSPLSRKSA